MNILHERGAQRANDVLRRPFQTAGLAKLLGAFLILAFFNATLPAGSVTLAWDPSPSISSAGYNLYYGLQSGVYSSSVDEGTNLTGTIAGLTPGVTYYYAVTDYDTNADESAFSNEVTNRVPILPSIIDQPLTQSAIAGTPVTFSVSAGGDPPLSIQWMDGHAQISSATNSILSWPQISDGNAGNYTVIVSNPWGSATSAVATLTVIVPPAVTTQPQSQTVIAKTAASFSSAVTGTAPLSLQWSCGAAAIAGATNSTLVWASVASSNAGNYHFTVSNSGGAVTSAVATLTVIVPPAITTQPHSQTVIAKTAASFSSAVTGTAPLSLQWYCGVAAIAGATNSTLAWASVASSNAGNYHFTVSNSGGAVTSAVATLAVIVPPAITTQPQSQTVIATTAAAFSSTVTGTAPLSLQWYCGAAAVAGATNSTLAWASAASSNAGNYHFTVSNSGGAVTSAVATLTVLPTNTMATAAGAYNGLLFQTNANATPEVTEATAGFLGNCVVASNGAFSTTVKVGGMTYLSSGAFDISGNASVTIPRTGAGLSNLTAVLHLDLINGTRQITGTISSTTAGNAWTAFLVADLATNACPQLAGVALLVSPGLSNNSPTNYGVASGIVVNSVLSLSGLLGDASPFSQTVPISKDGNVPLCVNLYTNGGLLEGWINLAGGTPAGNLTWIRPAGVALPPGFPQGFGTMVEVTGATFAQGVGYFWAADQNNNRVEVFSSSGAYVSQFGSGGSGNGKLLSPAGVAIDSGGNIWVADMGNNRVEEFSSGGTYLSQFGSLGSGNGQFNGPTGSLLIPVAIFGWWITATTGWKSLAAAAAPTCRNLAPWVPAMDSSTVHSRSQSASVATYG